MTSNRFLSRVPPNSGRDSRDNVVGTIDSFSLLVSPALAGRPFRRCLSGVALLVSHSRDCDVVDVDHDYKFDMFAARNFFINRTRRTFQRTEMSSSI